MVLAVRCGYLRLGGHGEFRPALATLDCGIGYGDDPKQDALFCAAIASGYAARPVGGAVRFADRALELRVAGPLRRRGEQAIERARERVLLHHGTLDSTTREGQTEAVVSLPIFATA